MRILNKLGAALVILLCSTLAIGGQTFAGSRSPGKSSGGKSESKTPSLPESPPPEKLHVLRLIEPKDSSGALTMTKVVQHWGAATKRFPSEPAYYTDISYVGSGRIAVHDEIADWTFVYIGLSIDLKTPGNVRESFYGLHGLGLRMTNRASSILEVDWNRTVLTSPTGQAFRVLHQGIRLADSANSMAPSVILADASLIDYVFPAELVSYERSGLEGWKALGFFEPLQQDMQVSLTVALKIEERSLTKKF